MSKLQAPEFPAMVFFITDNRRTSFDTEIKCPECQYIYPTEKIKKHMCHILDHIICKGCEQYYPNKSMKRHLFTYYKCKQHYEENENDKMELKKILKERKLNDLDEEPYPTKCLCIWNVGKCHFCDL